LRKKCFLTCFIYPFKPKALRATMPFREFREKLEQSSTQGEKKYYLQHYLGGLKQLDLSLVLPDSDGKLINDIDRFKWNWLNSTTQINSSIPCASVLSLFGSVLILGIIRKIKGRIQMKNSLFQVLAVQSLAQLAAHPGIIDWPLFGRFFIYCSLLKEKLT